MNKNLLILALCIGMLAILPKSYAQTIDVKKIEDAIKTDGSYAMLVQNARHFIGAIKTGEVYKKKHPKIQFQVVLFGEIVKDLAFQAELLPYIEIAEKMQVPIVVCEQAMKKHGITIEQYHPSILTTSSAYTYTFGLQELGYKTITL